MLKALYQLLKKPVFKGEEWQLLRYFQEGRFGRNPPKYAKILRYDLDNDLAGTFNRWDKRRITQKLSRLILLIEADKFTLPVQQNFFRAIQQMAIARICRVLNAQATAHHFAQKAFRIARYYQFQDVMVNAAEMLMIFGSLQGDLKTYRYYEAYYRQALRIMGEEGAVKSAYHAIEAQLVQSSAYTAALKQELEEAIEQAAHTYHRASTYILLLYLSRLRSFYYELEYDFPQVLATWQTFDEYVAVKKRFFNPDHQGESYIKQMAAFLNMRNHKEARKLTHQALKAIEPSNWNWFYFNHLYLLLLMQQYQFKEAYSLLKQVFQKPKFHRLPEPQKEVFLLINGFMAFVIESEWDPGFSRAVGIEGKGFKVHKLINDLRRQTQDKYGANAVIILLELLFYLNRQSFEALMSRQESLKLYKNRYLRHRPHKRMFYFFDMLHQAIQLGFDRAKTEARTRNTYQALKDTAFLYEGGYEDLEVLPFEDLWDWVLARLR